MSINTSNRNDCQLYEPPSNLSDLQIRSTACSQQALIKLYPQLYVSSENPLRVIYGDISCLVVPNTVIAQMVDRVIYVRHPTLSPLATIDEALIAEWIALFHEYGGTVNAICNCG